MLDRSSPAEGTDQIPGGATALELQGLRKSYGKAEVIHGVDLSVSEGEFVVFVGPSGCGKSTLLRMISGLEDITDGNLILDGRRVNDVSPARRGTAMVFQSYALYPHLTVAENIAFGLKVRKTPKDEIARRVDEATRVLQLDAMMGRYPRELSGGQRQRVAIGRAIVAHPRIFLFDEPLSNLDAELRVHMRAEIAGLHDRLGNTMIYVTHDQIEAMTLADRIVVLRDGRIEQVGTPRELYMRPTNLFVAQFIGSPRMNVFPVDAISSGRALDMPEGTHRIGLRPEDIDLVSRGQGMLSGTVGTSEYTGATALAHVDLDTASDTILTIIDGRRPVSQGTEVGLRFDPTRAHFFDADGRALRD